VLGRLNHAASAKPILPHIFDETSAGRLIKNEIQTKLQKGWAAKPAADYVLSCIATRDLSARPSMLET
jgi:hypothetical protein